MLLEAIDLFLLSGNLGCALIDVGAVVLLDEGFLRIGIVLNLVLVFFALKNVEFLFGCSEFAAEILKAFAPVGFIFLLVGGVFVFVADGLIGIGLRSFGVCGGGGGSGGGLLVGRGRGHIVIGDDVFRLGLRFLLGASFTGGIGYWIAGGLVWVLRTGQCRERGE